ncbi:AAA family ATPase [Rubrobacter aplysinae]|uniref:AAA family ATPase n=1 Tax=Rubrobacter aplysinae TaxID=909625 RepID=UPI00069DF1DA|nr:AAA family ATPase [Rubrobacter aplysinae]
MSPYDSFQNAYESTHSGAATFSAVGLMAMDLPPVQWCVPGLLPEGVTILAGKPKLGKSWLSLNLALAVASGGLALGARQVERGECLYMALEDNQRRLQKRLSKLLGGDDPPGGLHMATSWRTMDDGGAEDLDNWLQDHPQCRLVVVDVLQKVRPHAAASQAVYASDYRALQALHEAAAKHSVAALVVHHLRKAEANDPLDEISGSTGLSGAADGMLVLKRDRGRSEAYLHVDGRDIEEPAEHALMWDSESCSWTLAGDAEEFRISRERTEILRVLEESPAGMTPTEIADASDRNPNSTKKLVWNMSRDGQITSDSGRYYPVTRNLGNP